MRVIDYARLDGLAADLMSTRKAYPMRERGYVYRHCKRVAVGVIALRHMALSDASHDDALRIAAMFHDVGKGIEPHEQTGAAIAREVLGPILDPTLLEQVIALIAGHRKHATGGLWVKLLQDADILDHFGTIEVGMNFQHGAFSEEGMPHTLDYYQRELDRHAAQERALLHFNFSRDIFDEKVAFSRAFADRLAIELSGRYIQSDPT